MSGAHFITFHRAFFIMRSLLGLGSCFGKGKAFEVLFIKAIVLKLDSSIKVLQGVLRKSLTVVLKHILGWRVVTTAMSARSCLFYSSTLIDTFVLLLCTTFHFLDFR